MPSDFPSFIESPFNTRVEYEEAKKLPEAERRLALHRAKKAPNTAPEAPALLALPAPEPAASGGGGIRTLDVLSGTPVVLDQYGPVVVNTDGTISRITNWDRMSEAEREVAKRRIAKRNVERMKAFAAAGELKEELVSALQTPDAPPPDSPPPDAPPPPPHAPKTPKTEHAPMPDKCPVVAPDSVMDQKAHGTSETPVQRDLRWGCDWDTADRICNFNRHYAEHSGYFRSTGFPRYLHHAQGEGEQTMDFFDSNTGELLFTAPKGRSWDAFWKESVSHGWPSFRDPEVNWARVRCLANGECVSVDGTHLGHNLPDSKNRYCINLVSVAGRPKTELAPMPDKCPVVAPDSVMDQKAHGTSETPVQRDLRWGCDRDTADKICNFNRHYAEHSGYFESRRRGFFAEFEAAKAAGTPMRYHDSNTGELLFTAPVGRTHDEFWAESMSHGWPSFRDPEVNWARVRCLANGECVSVDGTHLGHNLPKNGRNRYCINLVSVAGRPESGGQASG